MNITDSGTLEFSFQDVADAVHEERKVGRRVLIDAIQKEIAALDEPCQSIVKKALLRVYLSHIKELGV